MGVAVDATNAYLFAGGAATSFSFGFASTVGAGDNALAVAVLWDGDPGAIVAPPAWNSVNLSQIGTTENNGTTNFGSAWGLINPTPGVHLSFGMTWTNSVVVGFLFLPVSGADASTFANTFKNFVSATGTSAAPTATITDGSGTPSNNLAVSAVSTTGGSLVLASGQTDVGQQVGGGNTDDAAYGASSASQAFSYTGSLSRPWLELGFTINAAGGGGDTFANAGSLRFMREKIGGLFKPVRKLLVPGFRPEPAWSF